MKTLHIIIISLCVCMICHVNAQGQTITVGTDATNTSAILDLQSTQHGLLIPRMTGAERNAIKSPAEGLMIYNTSTDKLNIYTGSEGWYSLQAIQAGAATGSVAIGGGLSVNETGVDPHDVAIMDVSSTDKGFLLPRTQTADVGGAAESMLFFNTLSKRIRMYNGTEWKELLHQFESTTTADGTAGARGMLIANTGETEPHHSAMLELRSNNDEGLLIPRMTTAQRDALAPVQGLIVYNTETKKVNYCTGSHWMEVETEAEEFSGDGQPCVDLPEFEDTRNGYVYPTVQIGDQCWMAKNLAYLPVVHSNTQFETQSNNSQPGYGVYGYNGSDVATAKSQANYANYGVLYNWFAVNQSGVNAICPTGWHLPSDAEWTQLTNYVVSQGYPNSNVVNGTGNALKSCRQVNSPLGGACNTSVHPRWSSNVTHHGFDKFGFSAFSGGHRGTNGIFEYVGVNGYWWASTEYSSAGAWSHRMSRGSGSVHRGNLNKGSGFSVRCLRDCHPEQPIQGTHIPNKTQIQWSWNTSAEADGYKYNTVNDYSTATDNGTSTTYTQEGLDCETEYTLYVWAYNYCGNSTTLNMLQSTISCVIECGVSTVTFLYNGNMVTYGTVEREYEGYVTTRCWLDRNLGATQIATAINDAAAYGDVFQWGRLVDGHQIRTSASTTMLSITDIPGHSQYIIAASSPYDWRTPKNDNLWQGASGINNPCPDGWRIPREAEWNAERSIWTANNSIGAFDSPLKLTAAGYRHRTNASLYSVDSAGYYWSNATASNAARSMFFHASNANNSNMTRAMGLSVRCVKECPIPEQPEVGTHIPGNNQIQWNWSSVMNADGYKYNTVNNYATATDNGTSTTCTIENLNSCVEYTLYLWAYNSCGGSELLLMKQTTTGDVPDAPIASTHYASDNQIVWNWETVENTSGYKYNTVNNYSTAINAGTNTTFTQIGLNCGTEYSLYVWAYFACETSVVMELNESTVDCPWDCGDNFTDIRDNNVYTTVQIGNQCWMAKNLAYLPIVHSNTEFETQGNNSQPAYGVYGYNGSDVATAKSQANFTNYGVLYNWFAVNQGGVNAICPTGWHLPCDAEWTQLTNYVVNQGYPNSNVVNGTGNALKSCRQVNSPLGGACNTSVHPRWSSNVTHHGFDKFGFSAFSGGYRGTNGIFEYVGVNGYWWASTECSSASAWSHRMSRGSGNVHRGNLNNGSGLSVRCIKDGFSCEAPPAPTQGTHTPAETQIQWNWNSSAGADGYKYNTVNDYSTATDIGTSTTYTQEGLVCGTPYTLYVWAYNECGASDVLVLNESTSDCPWACGDNFTDTRDNNVYTTVQIGNQCWMAKNLAYLPSVVGPETGSETTPYYYVNGYNGTNVSLAKAQANYATYGVLYNWAAAMSSSASSTANPSGVQGICPVGWHLPSDAEWTELTDYLGGWQVAGGKLKNSGTTYWSSPNTGATNISGFTALPGGYRHYGYFDNICYVGSWWSATETYLIDNVWFRNMLYDYSYVNKSGNNKELGYSVRCLRD